MSLVDLGYYENNDDKLSEISDLLKKLPLYTFYEKVNKELGNNEETNSCNECTKKLSSTDQEDSQLRNLCKSFCNISSKISDFNLHCDSLPCKRSCRYMNLWLYSNVVSITQTPSIIEQFYQILQNIKKNPPFTMNYCDIQKFKADPKNFNNFKYLYEFLFTYDDINRNISQKRNRKDQLYCNHIKENFRFYNKIKKECDNLDKCPYNSELQQFKIIFSDSTNLTEIYRKCNYEETPCKEASTQAKDVPCLKVKESTFTPQIKDPDQDKVAHKIFNGLTYSIPTLATLTMLYKFTPIGSWLYSKIKRTNNMDKNINAENYYISHHNTRIEEIDPGNSSNNTH